MWVPHIYRQPHRLEMWDSPSPGAVAVSLSMPTTTEGAPSFPTGVPGDRSSSLGWFGKGGIRSQVFCLSR
jgi:hypothetical protein